MAHQQSTLTEQPDYDRVELSLKQHPLLTWALISFVCTFGAFGLGTMIEELTILICVFFPMTFISMFAASAWTPRATFQISPSRLVIDAWAGGLLPRPAQYVIDTAGLQIGWQQGVALNNVQLFKLVLTEADGSRTSVPSLRCTEAELQQLDDRVEGLRALADLRHGEGDAEVPAALRQLAEVPERET